MDFQCVDECSKCCIERDYYPSVEYGKIGVLILPEEKEKIENLANQMGLDVTILPRIGITESSNRTETSELENDRTHGPAEIVAYQLMGKDSNGNTCPFLDTESNDKSPHGGHKCKIYQNRPLACKAYPLIESERFVTLDSACEFCRKHSKTDFNPYEIGNLNCEKQALSEIKEHVGSPKSANVWRFATGVAEDGDQKHVKFGWIKED